MAFPALQRDSHNPSGALADGGSRPAWEKFARRDEAGLAAFRYGQKKLPGTELVQPQPILVVFSETRRLEDQIVFRAGQAFQSLAGESGADAVGGNEAAHVLARRH